MTKTTGREKALAKPVIHTQTHTENTSHALLLHIPHSSTHLTQQLLTASGQVLILDCHSFPPALPYYPPGPCPDICLGADSYHTPAYLIETARSFLERRGYEVAVNHPFSGSLVPLVYYQKERRVRSLMLEVNRRLYCDEKNRKLPLFGQLQKDLQEMMKELKEI